MEDRIEQPPAIPVGTAIRLVIGTFLIAVGVLLTLHTLDILDTVGVLRYWPLVFVAVGGLKVAGRRGVAFGVVLMVAGVWMTAYNAGWIHFTVFELWPLLLIGFGVAMVSRAFGWTPPRPFPRNQSTEAGSADAPQDTASSWAILTTRNLVETSQEFTGAEAHAFMGSWRIDLTRARFAGGRAVLNVSAVVGGIEILVADDCEVIGELVPVMAGFEVKSQSRGSRSGGQLVVRGTAFMAGVEVKSLGRLS